MNVGLGYYLAQPYVLRALLVAVLVAFCAALLGVSLVLKRYSLIGDGLSHVAFGSMAVAAVTSVAELYISLPVTVLSAVALLRGSTKSKLKGDAAIAVVSVSSLAIAYLLFSKFSTGNVSSDVCKTLFGASSIMTLSDTDVLLSVILTLVVFVFYLFFYHKIFAVTFDPAFSEATGVKTKLYDTLLAVITGIVIVLAMKLVGALLITALIVFPALSAMRLFRSFRKVTVCAAVISVICAVTGILISLLVPGLPVGSCIVVANLLIFGIFYLIAVLCKGGLAQ